MKRTALHALVLSLVLAGCSSRSSSPTAGEKPQPKPLPDPMTVPVNPRMAPVDPAITRVDAEMLTFMARHYAQFRKHPPRSLDELVKAHYLMRVPSPPPGMCYRVDPHLVCVTLTRD